MAPSSRQVADAHATDHGASGAPVLDCEGRVVAVISNIFTQTLEFPSRASCENGRPDGGDARFGHVKPVSARLVARVAAIGFLDLLQHLAEVVALRGLQRRELLV